jgi:hypothetical protein
MDTKLWDELTAVYAQYTLLTQKLFEENVDRVALFKKTLRIPGIDRATALHLFKYLDENERKQLLGELVFLASFNSGYTVYARELILDLPRKWVLSQIEGIIQEAVNAETDDFKEITYDCLLLLYRELDKDFAEGFDKKVKSF